MDKATGNKEIAVDNSCQFTSTPYLVEFKNTAKYFKPGLRYVVKVGFLVKYRDQQIERFTCLRETTNNKLLLVIEA